MSLKLKRMIKKSRKHTYDPQMAYEVERTLRYMI
jgi:hypothetical protein